MRPGLRRPGIAARECWANLRKRASMRPGLRRPGIFAGLFWRVFREKRFNEAGAAQARNCPPSVRPSTQP